MNYLNEKKLVLASQSPRRKTLLELACIDLIIQVSNIDESTISFTSPTQFVQDLAFLKAQAVSEAYPDSWILGADTIVTIDDQILGKPANRDDAVSMLNQLNNRTHQVYTGVCLYKHQNKKKIVQSVSTKVVFKSLTNKEINWYVNTKEPYDKAGGYGIQGVGAFLVKKIYGSYTNVVGLPVCEVIQMLLQLKFIQM
ncbi:MAG: Maf family protein [Pseudomonadota bacterium]